MSGVLIGELTLVITTTGPGTLHVLNYDISSGASGILRKVIGSKSTAKTGETRFIISHVYNYKKLAFYWDGAGEAVYGIGASLLRQSVGKSWSNASVATWGSSTITTVDVSAEAKTAESNVENRINAYYIPDLI